MEPYRRNMVDVLVARMSEPRRFIQVLKGPRQTGKTTALSQALQSIALPYHYANADDAFLHGREWLRGQWEFARALITATTPSAVLVIDEVQSISQWSKLVKLLWDEDAWAARDLRVVLSGSSSLLLQSGLSESLVGRFESIISTHWTFDECRTAFGYSIRDFLVHGGYPGAATMKDDVDRWRDYIEGAIVEGTLSKDIVSLENIRKPAVLQALYRTGIHYSTQEVSYRKLLGQLDDAGNTNTIAHYLELLGNAGLLCGIHKYSGKPLTIRTSSPKILAFDTSLICAASQRLAQSPFDDPERYGRLVESAVGAYLLARAARERFEIYWWRENDREVDFVISDGERRTAIEVKSGRIKSRKGMVAFATKYPGTRALTVGSPQAPLEDFLAGSIELF